MATKVADGVAHREAMSFKEKMALVIVVSALALLCNWQFVNSCDLSRLLNTNDVPGILSGYRSTPNLITDGLRWWHGTWIQEGVHTFRPLTSYLYWIESWIGLHWGFIWVGCIGFLLFVANCLLSSALAWQLTGSKICTALAAALATLVRFVNVGQKDLWLAWYPGHQELLMNGLMLGALLCLDLWYQRAEQRYLFWWWALFLLGCLAKEHVYIFPFMAAVVVLGRRSGARVTWRQGLWQVALMSAAVLGLWFYRAAVIADARNPSLIPIQFLRKPLLFMYKTWAVYSLTGQSWFPGLAILIFVLGGFAIRFRLSGLRHERTDSLLTRLGLWLFLTLLISTFYVMALRLLVAIPSASEVFWFLFEKGPVAAEKRCELLIMVLDLYVVHLLWKYRKQEPTVAAWAFLLLSYMPVLDYIGWHYTMPAWFIRSTYWALVAKLIWIDVGKSIPWNAPPLIDPAHLAGTPFPRSNPAQQK